MNNSIGMKVTVFTKLVLIVIYYWNLAYDGIDYINNFNIYMIVIV